MCSITKEDLERLENAVEVMCEFCEQGICEYCPDQETLRHWKSVYNEEQDDE